MFNTAKFTIKQRNRYWKNKKIENVVKVNFKYILFTIIKPLESTL